MVKKRTEIKPSRKASGDLKDWARRARQFHDKLAAEGRHFGDSTEIIRADRNFRI